MKSYLVGGAVRDALLGLPVKDKDWVVVGATPKRCLTRLPAGRRDFPCSSIRKAGKSTPGVRSAIRFRLYWFHLLCRARRHAGAGSPASRSHHQRAGAGRERQIVEFMAP